VDAAAFQKSVVERLLRYPRFHQRVDEAHGLPRWKREPQLDFRYHISVRRLPAGSFDRSLHRAVAIEMGRALDRNRPLWRLVLFPRPGGPVTVLFRAHHAVADGIALVTLLVDSTDSGILRAPDPAEGPTGKVPHGGPLGGIIDQLEALNVGLERLRLAWRRARRHPTVARQQIQAGRKTLAAARRVLRLPDDNPPALRAALSGQRAVAWLHDTPLAPLRECACSRDVRVNDLLMTALAGAFARELQRRQAPLGDGQNLRVSIPVNLRNGRGRELGNRFGLILLDLPVGVQDPDVRLQVIASRIAQLKESPEARATLMGLEAAGYLPVPFEKRLVGMISAKSVAVVSNLPGPKRPVSIAGAILKNLVFWPPQAGGIGIGVSFFSYAGALSLGVSADAAMLPQPQLFIDAFLQELARLKPLRSSSDEWSKAPLLDQQASAA
jgi:WS/DGAT/MGAT family acyltransferase